MSDNPYPSEPKGPAGRSRHLRLLLGGLGVAVVAGAGLWLSGVAGADETPAPVPSETPVPTPTSWPSETPMPVPTSTSD